MFNENIVLERGSPPQCAERLKKGSITRVTSSQHWREARCDTIWSAIRLLWKTNINLYSKLVEYTEGTYQKFSDEELDALRKLTIFDSENRIDKFTLVAIKSATNQ